VGDLGAMVRREGGPHTVLDRERLRIRGTLRVRVRARGLLRIEKEGNYLVLKQALAKASCYLRDGGKTRGYITREEERSFFEEGCIRSGGWPGHVVGKKRALLERLSGRLTYSTRPYIEREKKKSQTLSSLR